MWNFFGKLAKDRGWPWRLSPSNIAQLERGCVGLTMFRLGYFNSSKHGGLDFPYEIPGSVMFDRLPPALDYYLHLKADSKPILVAMQLPGEPSVQLDSTLENQRRHDHQIFPGEIKPDAGASRRPGVTYNFATFWELGGGSGYWEFMTHEFTWDRLRFPKQPPFPTVSHHGRLPTTVNKAKYTTFYIVALPKVNNNHGG